MANPNWQKGGASPNPGGRPKALEAFRGWLSKTREQRQKVLEELLASTDERVRMEALKHADAYDYGKPTQTLEHAGADGEQLKVVVMQLPREIG